MLEPGDCTHALVPGGYKVTRVPHVTGRDLFNTLGGRNDHNTTLGA
jgi:hypothetical protein